jgi:hypothetical protein
MWCSVVQCILRAGKAHGSNWERESEGWLWELEGGKSSADTRDE